MTNNTKNPVEDQLTIYEDINSYASQNNRLAERLFLAAKTKKGKIVGMSVMTKSPEYDSVNALVSAIIGRGIGTKLANSMIEVNRQRKPRVPLINYPLNDKERKLYEKKGLVNYKKTPYLQRIPSQEYIAPPQIKSFTPLNSDISTSKRPNTSSSKKRSGIQKQVNGNRFRKSQGI